MTLKMYGALLICLGVFGAIQASSNVEFGRPRELYVTPENQCSHTIETCRKSNPQLAYEGLPEHVYSPDELETHCGSKLYSNCLKEIDTEMVECAQLQVLQIQGEIKAEDYICSEDAMKKYRATTKYHNAPWSILRDWYIPDDNHMCNEHFLAHSYSHFNDAETILLEIDALPDDATGNDVLLIEKRSKAEADKYCNYMYAYQNCLYQAATRHCNESIGDWQYEVSKEYFRPHFEKANCHIGKGLAPITISAIIIVSVILALIFSLAAFCGVYEKCFEKCKECRARRKRHSDDDEDKRTGIVVPTFAFDNYDDEQHTSKVRFDE